MLKLLLIPILAKPKELTAADLIKMREKEKQQSHQ
jgi:hypothetical protein